MKVKVIYAHDIGYVDSSELDSLILKGKIMGFVRDGKLVIIGIHLTRKASTTTYLLDKRRSDVAQKG